MNDKIFNEIREGILEVLNKRSVYNGGRRIRTAEQRATSYINRKIYNLNKQKKFLLLSPADAVYNGQSYIPQREEERESINRIIRLYEVDEIIWIYAQFRYILRIPQYTNMPIYQYTEIPKYREL